MENFKQFVTYDPLLHIDPHIKINFSKLNM